MHPFRVLFLSALPWIGSITAFADTPLDGDWHRDCWRGDLDLNIEEDTQFHDSVFTLERRFSAQDTCARTDFQFIAHGGFVVPGASEVIPGAWNVDVAWNSAEAKTLHEEATRAFNQMAACGFTDWETNVPKDVGGRHCETMLPPLAGSTFYLVFKVEGDRYYPGNISIAPFDGTAPDRRPTTLAMSAGSVRRTP